MKTTIKQGALIALVLLIGLQLSCTSGTGTSTPSTPQTPQQTVMNIVQTGAAADNAYSKVLTALCTVQSGQTSPAINASDCATYAKYGAVFPPIFDAIAAEAASSDPWSCPAPVAEAPACNITMTAKYRIASIAANGAISATITNQTVLAAIEAIQVALNQILAVQ